MQVGLRDPQNIANAMKAGKASGANNTILANNVVANAGVSATTGGDKVASGTNITPTTLDPGVQNTPTNFNSTVNASGIQYTQAGNIGAGKGGQGALLAFGKKDDNNKTTGLNNGSFDFGIASDEDGKIDAMGLPSGGNPLHRKIVHPDGREGMMAIG